MSALHLISATACVVLAALFWLVARVWRDRIERAVLRVCSAGYVAAGVLWVVF